MTSKQAYEWALRNFTSCSLGVDHLKSPVVLSEVDPEDRKFKKFDSMGANWFARDLAEILAKNPTRREYTSKVRNLIKEDFELTLYPHDLFKAFAPKKHLWDRKEDAFYLEQIDCYLVCKDGSPLTPGFGLSELVPYDEYIVRDSFPELRAILSTKLLWGFIESVTAELLDLYGCPDAAKERREAQA